MTDARNRQPRGIPVGGQFATNEHDEAGALSTEAESVDDIVDRIREGKGDYFVDLDHLEEMATANGYRQEAGELADQVRDQSGDYYAALEGLGELAEAEGGLALAQDDIFAEAAKPLTIEEAMEMVSSPGRYSYIDPFTVSGRFVDLVPPTPSLRIDRERPTFTDEKEFAYALSRIDGLWSKDDSIDGRSERIIADMRRSGALGEGAGSAREAYARALVLNEAGYIDEERVNHLLDHIESGGADYKNQARSFGYHPEQFLSDIHSAADAAGYRADHADSDDGHRAAIQRAGILDAEARRFAASANRGWTSLEEDTERYRNGVRVLNEKLAGDLSGGAKDKKIAAELDHNNRIDITAERDAYAFMLDKIEGRWTND